MDVQHEPDQNRFTATTDDGHAVLDYQRRGDAVAFVHTLVPSSARGQGVGSALAEAGLAWARENERSVIPECPFIAAYVRDHPETQDLIAKG